jgi:shikimate dehydrogenase
MTAIRELYGLLGDPVDHSLSPEIQAAAFGLVARSAAYLPFHVPPAELPAAFAAARTLRMKGFNVTIPHKEGAVALVDALEGDAAGIRAVNVVVNRSGRLVGHNTDAMAVTSALERLSFDVRGQRALVLGAGGAARAAVWALGRAGAAEVLVANRTFDRARTLADGLSGHGIVARATPFGADALGELVPGCRLVVNATSVGLKSPSSSPLPDSVRFDPAAVVVDMVYRPLRTRLLEQAQAQGVRTIDGLEILVQQAIGSLSVWLGRPMDAARLGPVMRAAALEVLQ